jgi:hypothetical protein
VASNSRRPTRSGACLPGGSSARSLETEALVQRGTPRAGYWRPPSGASRASWATGAHVGRLTTVTHRSGQRRTQSLQRRVWVAHRGNKIAAGRVTFEKMGATVKP